MMRHIELAGVALMGLLMSLPTGCSLVGAPNVSLSPRGVYTSAPVVIPYTFSGPSNPAWCRYSLFKVQPGNTAATEIGAPVTADLPSSGNLVVDIAGMTGSPVVDGNYSLDFGVLTNPDDQDAIPTLTRTVDFSVETGPYIASTTPEVINTNSLPSTLTLNGWDFGTSPTVSVTGTTFSYGATGSTSTSVALTGPASFLPAPGDSILTVTSGSTTSPFYLLPVVTGSLGSTLTVNPTSSASGTSGQQITIQGFFFTPYTSVDFVDSNGNEIPFTVTAFSGGDSSNGYASSLAISADLANAAPGDATITLTANDGVSVPASVAFGID